MTCEPSGYALVHNFVEADGAPSVLHPVDGGCSVCERSYAVALTGKDIAASHAERSSRQVAAAAELVNDGLRASVDTGDAVIPGHGPGDVRCQ